MTDSNKNNDWTTPHGRLAFVLPDGFNQDEMAKKLGISRGTWNACLKGKKLPSLNVYLQIVDMTGANLDWLVFGNGLPHGGIDLQRFKNAVGTTIRIGVDAASQNEPLSDSVLLGIFMSHYQREMADEAEHVRKFGYGTTLKPEATNDTTTLSDSNRKTVS